MFDRRARLSKRRAPTREGEAPRTRQGPKDSSRHRAHTPTADDVAAAELARRAKSAWRNEGKTSGVGGLTRSTAAEVHRGGLAIRDYRTHGSSHPSSPPTSNSLAPHSGNGAEGATPPTNRWCRRKVASAMLTLRSAFTLAAAWQLAPGPPANSPSRMHTASERLTWPSPEQSPRINVAGTSHVATRIWLFCTK